MHWANLFIWVDSFNPHINSIKLMDAIIIPILLPKELSLREMIKLAQDYSLYFLF